MAVPETVNDAVRRGKRSMEANNTLLVAVDDSEVSDRAIS
jgi:hypothetical protein